MGMKGKICLKMLLVLLSFHTYKQREQNNKEWNCSSVGLLRDTRANRHRAQISQTLKLTASVPMP